MVMPAKTASDYAVPAQKAAAEMRKQKKAIRITAKQKALVNAMVADGLPRKDAAKLVGITDETARASLLKPQVLAYLNQQKEMLRTSLAPRALLRIGELIDKADSDRVRLDAAKYIDGMDRPSHAVGATQVNVQVNNNVSVTPGYVIDLTADSRESSRKIAHLDADEAIPLSSLDDVPVDD